MRQALAAALICAEGQSISVAGAAEGASGWVVSVAHENDLFNHGDDRDYTSGTLFSVTAPGFAFPKKVAAKLKFFQDSAELVGDFSVTQAIYTPRNLTIDPPDPKDRPYAGILLANVGVIDVTETDRAQRRLDYLSLSLGAIGPDSLAEQAQKWIHQIRGATNPVGWEHQIGGAVAAQLRYQRTYLFPPLPAPGERLVTFAVEPEYEVALGNVKTEAAAGGSVRVGLNAPADLGVPRLEPATPGSGYFVPSGRFLGLGGYLFAGVHEHYVGYDVTFDRAPDENGPGVDKLNWVSDAQVGGVLAFWRLRASYTHEFLSNEFRGQQHGHGFGAVSLSVNFGAARPL